MAITIASAAAAAVTTASPSVTFGSAAAENDIVAFWVCSSTTAAIGSVPSGWVNPLGGTTMVNSDSHAQAMVYHQVTAGEAGTTTFTATSLFNASETGNVCALLLRGVSPTGLHMAAASTFSSANAATPHVLAGIASGSVTASGATVFSGVCADSAVTYTTPTGWTVQQTSASTLRQSVYTRDALTTSGVAVDPEDVTPSAGNEYASITVIFIPTQQYSETVDNTITATAEGLIKFNETADHTGTATTTLAEGFHGAEAMVTTVTTISTLIVEAEIGSYDPPTSLNGSPGNTQVVLTWTAPTTLVDS